MPNAEADWPDRRLPAPQPLPSILDLARHASVAVAQGDELGDRSARPDGLVGTVYGQDEALRDLLLTLRARTLGDAAAQLWAGFRVAEELQAGMPPEELKRGTIALCRVFLSTLPLVAEAAGLDLAEIGAEPSPVSPRMNFRRNA